MPTAVAQQENEQDDASRETRREVRVVESAGSKPRPAAVEGEPRKDQGEERGPEHEGEGETPARRPAHFPPARRERTKSSTVWARAGGTSFGFNIFRVFPVAR